MVNCGLLRATCRKCGLVRLRAGAVGWLLVQLRAAVGCRGLLLVNLTQLRKRSALALGPFPA